LYDIPLACSMAWLTWIGLRSNPEKPQSDGREASTVYGIWVARGSMIAAFSLPLLAAWAMSEGAVPMRVRLFRLLATLIATLFMAMMVFRRQNWLERELVHMLNDSRESFENLKRLQDQMLQSEKMASIGQLVGGAAHELNNPITAMLGYSDLLLNTHLTSQQKPLAAKIGHDIRRTKSLVASLISFARRGTAPKTPLDLNTLVRTAIKLAQPQMDSLAVTVQSEFEKELPKILGDPNQLLQVCLQLLGNCLHTLTKSGRIVLVRTQREQDVCILSIASGPAASASQGKTSPALPTQEAQGLSACQGIVQEHGGRIVSRTSDATFSIRVELPALLSATSQEWKASQPGLWSIRPFA
jgi:signal transduction histidine kinase